jgi:DNA-3-methyladenine glycosylase
MLERDFFQHPACQVAPLLIGKKLVRSLDGQRLAGIITETEAYQGSEDQACHARVGKTKRNQVMFAEAGHAYIYFTYGIHWMLNVVTDDIDTPAAVLIRAIYPIEGLDAMSQNRPNLAFKKDWLNGPAKLTQALRLDGTINGYDLCSTEKQLYLEEGIVVPAEAVNLSPRIGLGSTPEPWLSKLWRWELDWNIAGTIINQNTGF